LRRFFNTSHLSFSLSAPEQLWQAASPYAVVDSLAALNASEPPIKSGIKPDRFATSTVIANVCVMQGLGCLQSHPANCPIATLASFEVTPISFSLSEMLRHILSEEFEALSNAFGGCSTLSRKLVIRC